MSEPGRALKVFVSGDVNGKFDSLFKRINSIQAKMGSFDILLCVGSFFGDDMSQWEPYKSGEKSVPVTTYVLGGCNLFLPQKKVQIVSVTPMLNALVFIVLYNVACML